MNLLLSWRIKVFLQNSKAIISSASTESLFKITLIGRKGGWEGRGGDVRGGRERGRKRGEGKRGGKGREGNKCMHPMVQGEDSIGLESKSPLPPSTMGLPGI